MGAFETTEHEKYVAEVRLIDGGFSWLFNRKVEGIIEEIKKKHKPSDIKRLIIFSPASVVCSNIGDTWDEVDREVGKVIKREGSTGIDNPPSEGVHTSIRRRRADRAKSHTKKSSN